MFGSVKTIHVECPSCGVWQFNCDTCECGELLKNHKLTDKELPEIRTEEPNWRDRIPTSVRERVYERDEYVCQYCGIWCYESYVQNPRAVVIDHAIPVAIGGNNDIDNLITSCRKCNGIKSDKIFETFEDARSFILKQILEN